MWKKILSLVFLVSGFLVSSAYAQEQITVTTYYPSPVGNYRDLQFRRGVVGNDLMPTVDGVINFQALGADPALGIPAVNAAGTIYYNAAAARFRFFNGATWRDLGFCIRFAFTINSGNVQCPVGYAIPMAPLSPIATSGNYVCCPFQ